MIDQENPFASSRGPASSDGSSGPPVVKEDVEGNLALTAKIAKISAGVCIFFALFYGFTWFKGFEYLMPLEMGVSWQHIIHTFRGTFVVCFALLAWRGWMFGRSIKNIPVGESVAFAKYVENQTWLWLTVGLSVFFMLVATALNVTASFAASGYWN